jgi:hypothetical protein
LSHITNRPIRCPAIIGRPIDFGIDDIFGFLAEPHQALDDGVHQLSPVEVHEVQVVQQPRRQPGLAVGELEAQALQESGERPGELFHQAVVPLHVLHRHVV